MKPKLPRGPGRTLGVAVVVVALFYGLSALTLPVADRRPPPAAVVASVLLLACHGSLYWLGDSVRDRLGLRAYAGAQAVLLFAIAVSRVPTPVSLGLLMTGTAELVLLARGRWSPVIITSAAVALYVAAALGTSGVYGAATAGLLIALTGTMAHALAALLRPPAAAPAGPTEPRPIASPVRGRWGELSPRENEVLRELVRGARNSEIAARLAISERTVKAHLAHIYQKLGVESRSAAVAAVLKEGLIGEEEP